MIHKKFISQESAPAESSISKFNLPHQMLEYVFDDIDDANIDNKEIISRIQECENYFIPNHIFPKLIAKFRNDLAYIYAVRNRKEKEKYSIENLVTKFPQYNNVIENYILRQTPSGQECTIL